MTEKIQIDPSDKLWPACLKIYLEAFPIDERRESTELEMINASTGYSFYALVNSSTLCGILEIWEFSNFIFIEHLAIIPSMQNKGLGRSALSGYLNDNGKPVILEAEVPHDDISTKRIDFYNSLGFRIIDVDYTQPPYYPGKKSVPMVLLSNKPLHLNSILNSIQMIRHFVYKMP
ncbi:MAG TPA: GNAT family N-acetyltransferase [Lentimicrobium sp.]|nr:GNAT family N-acetyltransferase [Lentimicrobium sp.]